MPPDPKPKPRIVNPGFGKAKLELEQLCRLCAKRTATDVAHLVPKGKYRGDDVLENCVPLCGPGHSGGCHRLVDLGIGDARARLRRQLTKDELDYIRNKMGAHWLAKRYPSPKDHHA